MAAPPKKKSVDEIWKELNAPKVVPRSTTTGITGFGIPGIQTHTRVIPKSQTKPSQSGQAAGDVSLIRNIPKAVEGSYDPRPAGITQEQLQQYVATVQRTLNCLSDPDRSTRKTAITSLQTKLLKGDTTTPKASPQMLQALLAGPLLHPLVTMLSDTMERCRLTVLQLLLDAAPQLADPGALLPGLLPQLVLRMGQLPVQEAAEEVRLTGLQLLEVIISKSPASQLGPATEDISLLLARGCEDAFHDAKKAAAAALVCLAERLPAGALEGQAERLVQAILPNLSHQHSKVRLTMLSGLRALVLSGLPAGLMHTQLAPALKPLTFDRAAAVREAYYAAVASWLGTQPGQQQQQGSSNAAAAQMEADAAHARCRTYAPVLLPLLLLGISDQQDSIAAATLTAVEEIGATWQQHGLGSSAVTTPAAICELPAPMDTDEQQLGVLPPAAAAATADASPAASTTGDIAVSAAAVAAAHLPPPYAGLPSLGCRQMVAALLPQLLPGILSGLKEWTNSLRSAAARSLHTCLVLAGSAVTPHLQQLLTALASAMSEEDADIVTALASCCRVIGAFVPCNAWLPLLVDALSDPKSGDITRANTLVVASCLLHAAAAAHQQPDQQLLQLLVGALAAEDVRCSQHAGVQVQLVNVVANLLEWMPEDVCRASAQQVYLITLQLRGNAALQQEADNTRAAAAAVAARGSSSTRAELVLQSLAQRAGLSSVGQLAELHAQELLRLLAADANSWSAGSPNLLAFMSLLRTTEGPCLAGLLPQVTQVLQLILADHDRDAALRLSLLKLLDLLLEQPSTAPAFGGDNASLALRSLIMPPLVWRAGKAAAAVRFAAITALSTFMAAQLAPAQVLLAEAKPKGGLLSLLAQCLDEDWYADVRHTACYVEQLLLQQVGAQLDDESRRAIYPELLKRLDDSNNRVRIAACAALVAFIRSAGSSYCPTNSGYLAAGVVLHMDDGDQDVAEAACQVLEALAATKPSVAAAEVKKVQDRFRARHYCDRVLLACAAAGGS